MYICERTNNCCEHPRCDHAIDTGKDTKHCVHRREVVPVVYAKWVWKKSETSGEIECHCNNCDGQLPYICISYASNNHLSDEIEYVNETKYCPHCGAKMCL